MTSPKRWRGWRWRRRKELAVSNLPFSKKYRWETADPETLGRELAEDHLQAIRERLTACDALRNLPQEEIGTLRHRMLDDTAYNSTAEKHIRALLDA